MERFKSNTSDIEKRAYNATQDLKEQNKKLVELNDRVHGIDEDINESEEYQQGMKNKFWGFIPSLITGLFKKKKKYKDKHIEKENKNDDDNNDSDKQQQQQNIMKEKIDVTKVKSQEDFDDLMARIKSMNKAASDLNKEIKASNELTDNLNKHLEYTKERLDKVQKNNDKILGKKNK
jgi:chromosome segregation ATPase